jgi:hypothetical protein
MKIHAVASTRQYRRHVEAVWKHLDPQLQGSFLTGRAATTKRLPPGDVVMVGGYFDIERAPQRIIYVEHGAGQAYAGEGKRHPCYHGAAHPARVIGYISPSRRVADSWGRPAYAAGCPALDWASHAVSPRKVAAFTFHFEARSVAPEARSAREYWVEDLHNMVALLQSYGYEVIGTWHPRDPVGHRIWRNIGIEGVQDPDEVLKRSQLVIADNSSLMFEAALLGRSVVALNAPWYRKDVEHGLRFWDHIPGANVDTLEQFQSLDLDTYCSSARARQAAKSAASYAYARQPGHAGEMAARWVEKLVGDGV